MRRFKHRDAQRENRRGKRRYLLLPQTIIIITHRQQSQESQNERFRPQKFIDIFNELFLFVADSVLVSATLLDNYRDGLDQQYRIHYECIVKCRFCTYAR